MVFGVGEIAMRQYQESSWKEFILEQLPRHMKCREVNKERLRHDTHSEMHKEVIEVHRSDLGEKLLLNMVNTCWVERRIQHTY